MRVCHFANLCGLKGVYVEYPRNVIQKLENPKKNAKTQRSALQYGETLPCISHNIHEKSATKWQFWSCRVAVTAVWSQPAKELVVLFSCFRADLWSWMCGLLRRVASQTVKSTRSSCWPPPCCKRSCLLFLFRSDWGPLGSLCMQRALRCQPCYMLELQMQTAACSFKDVRWVTNHKV